MSETKWTKGDWRWNMDEDGVGTLYGGEREAPKPLADFWRKPLRDIPQDTRFEAALKAEQIANLDICAAAPELYEAGEQSAIQLEEAANVVEGNGLTSLASIFREQVSKQRAALAKARGESQEPL